MTGQVHTLARPGASGRPPLVPARAVLKEDAIYLRFDPGLLDTRWYRSCTTEQALAGIALRARALKQEHAGSLPNDDGELAYLSDFGRDLAGWQGAKAKALEGWILCTDDRWHHPDIARNVLHIWIARLESRRIGAWGNVSRAKDGGLYGLDSILEDLDEALDALREIDPQDVVLRKASEQQSKWWDRLEQVRAGTYWADETGGAAEPIRLPNRMPNRRPPGGSPKVSEAKRSSEDSSSPRSGDDSSNQPDPPVLEVEADRRSAERTVAGRPKPERAPPWPPGWFETFRARGYPQRDNMAWGRAEKALDKIRKAQRVPFEDILAGVDRLAAQVEAGTLPPLYVPMPSTWLADRGWEDRPAAAVPSPAPPGRPGPGPDRTRGIGSAMDGFLSGLGRAHGRGPAGGRVIDHEPGGGA